MHRVLVLSWPGHEYKWVYDRSISNQQTRASFPDIGIGNVNFARRMVESEEAAWYDRDRILHVVDPSELRDVGVDVVRESLVANLYVKSVL